MEPGLEQLRKNYEELDNEELKIFIIKNAYDLRPEALELLKKIAEERGIANVVFILAEERNELKKENENRGKAVSADEKKNAAAYRKEGLMWIAGGLILIGLSNPSSADVGEFYFWKPVLLFMD